ncbi:MAG: Bor family protein [Gemmatimonadaceae bacterium]
MRRLSLGLAVLLSTGCYHATIETGVTPSAQVIEQSWAHSFVYGLVAPATVNTTSQCPRGVAKVETRHSFLNGLVAGLTWGLYTPISIKVTCAQ